MLKWNNPKEPHKIEINGVMFFGKVLTSGQRLTMLDEIRALRGTEADFDDLMSCLAQYVERIEFSEEVSGIVENGGTGMETQAQVTVITDPKEIKQNILYLDNLDDSYQLMEELMAVNQLRKAQTKN